MISIRRIAQRDPSATLSVLSLLAAPVAALAGKPEFAPVFVAVAAAILGLRTQVTPQKKAVETTQLAATQAAVEVAQNVTEATAGPVGQITGPAAQIVDEAVERALSLIGRKG